MPSQISPSTTPSFIAHNYAPATLATCNALRNANGQPINSHRITFESMDDGHVVSSVVGASEHINTPSNIAQSSYLELSARLSEAALNGSALISFGSPLSLIRLQTGSLKTNSTSLIEQLQVANKSTHGNLGHGVKVVSIQQEPIVHGQQTVQGRITLQLTEQGVQRTVTIPFIEYSPQYDGRCLTEEQLLACLDKLVTLEQSNLLKESNAHLHADTTHFYSAKGIGRSASLSVLHSFHRICSRTQGLAEFDTPTLVKRLIEQGRQARGRNFVNTAEQEAALLAACEQVSRRIGQQRVLSTRADQLSAPLELKPAAPASAPTETRKLIENLAQATPKDRLGRTYQPDYPYMPIRLAGIDDITASGVFTFPTLSLEQAQRYAADMVLASYFGDALGADLESNTFERRKQVIEGKMSPSDLAIINNPSTPALHKEHIYRNLLMKDCAGSAFSPTVTRHHATDDTQQGVLAAIEKMKWRHQLPGTMTTLPEGIMRAFSSPTLPSTSILDPQAKSLRFNIRGGAETIQMCQATDRADLPWHDRCIESLREKGKRAGGAGNGGLMRIAYDLLPLLAGKASLADLVEQTLLSNQVTHPSSFSAVASVAHVIMIAQCMHLRSEAEARNTQATLPPGFFINTYHAVAQALEGRSSYPLLAGHGRTPSAEPPDTTFTPEQWRTARRPSQFLKSGQGHVSTLDNAIQRGTVEAALLEGGPDDMEQTNLVLKRWGSNAYLGATWPAVVFLLERYGRQDPARAVELTALLTKDSDTCAAIVGQVMGALHGSTWVRDRLHTADGRRFDRSLGTHRDTTGGFKAEGIYPIDQFIHDLCGYYYSVWATSGTINAPSEGEFA